MSTAPIRLGGSAQLPPLAGAVPTAQAASLHPARVERAAPIRTGVGSAAQTTADLTLSPEARRAQSAKSFERELLASFERGLSADELELFEQAGRSGYLDSIASDTDTSAEGTANRILGGVTGYIFGAFELSRGELQSADLDEFEREALRGFERGFAQAKELIEGLGARSPELATDLDRTAELVRSGIHDFVEERRSALAG